MQNESSGSARIATHPIGSAPRRSAKIFMKQLPSTSVACTVLARECTGRPVIGAIALAAIGLTTRRFDDNLRRIGSSRAPGRAADYSGGSDRRVGRMGRQNCPERSRWRESRGSHRGRHSTSRICYEVSLAMARSTNRRNRVFTSARKH